jgi:hypothetical protein
MNRKTLVTLLASGVVAALALTTAPQAQAQWCWLAKNHACFVFAPGGAIGFGLPNYYRYGDAYSQVTSRFGYGQPVYRRGAPTTVGFEYPAAYGVPYIPPHDADMK